MLSTLEHSREVSIFEAFEVTVWQGTAAQTARALCSYLIDHGVQAQVICTPWQPTRYSVKVRKQRRKMAEGLARRFTAQKTVAQ